MNILISIFNILGFFFGGWVSSWIIAKKVINKKVEKEIQQLKNKLLIKEQQKRNFKNNVEWILKNYCLTLANKNNATSFKENSSEYINGFTDGLDSRTNEIINRIMIGIQSEEIFNSDYSLKN